MSMQANTLGSKALQFGSKTKKEQDAVLIVETRTMFCGFFFFLTSAYYIDNGT